jgi:hypothetical protein
MKLWVPYPFRALCGMGGIAHTFMAVFLLLILHFVSCQGTRVGKKCFKLEHFRELHDSKKLPTSQNSVHIKGNVVCGLLPFLFLEKIYAGFSPHISPVDCRLGRFRGTGNSWKAVFSVS